MTPIVALDRVFQASADRLDSIPVNTIDAWITSVPFETMRHYSDDPSDLGNYQGANFIDRLVPVIREWCRTLRLTGNLFLNFQPQMIGGVLSPSVWLLPQALAGNGFHVIQELWVVKTNAMPSNDPKLLKPCVERVIHAAKDPAAYVVNKDAVRRPSLWAHRDQRGWKYSASGADGGNFLAPALDRLNRLAIKDVLGMVCAEDPNALFIAKTQNQATVHKAKMADEAARWLIRYGSPVGGIVGDNFAGSGTTLIQAKALGRHFVGSDLDDNSVAQAEAALAEVEFGSLLGDSAAWAHSQAGAHGRVRRSARRLPSLLCVTCNKDFTQTKRWQTYCSDACRYRHHNGQRRKLCPKT